VKDSATYSQLINRRKIEPENEEKAGEFRIKIPAGLRRVRLAFLIF